MANITETIRNKKAMLEAVEDTMMYCINDKIEWYTNSLSAEIAKLEDYKADNPEWEETDWDIKNYTRTIEDYKARKDAFETIQKALEKLI